MSDRDWREFVREHGHRASGRHLALVLGVSEAAVTAARRGARRLEHPHDFGALFTLWHGRPPTADEWPVPRRAGKNYAWDTPEVELLASMVGRLSTTEIATALTARLRVVTGDPAATRDRASVIIAANRHGLQHGDVVGGLTVNAAAAAAGVPPMVIQQLIARGDRFTVTRVGHRVLLDPDEVDAFARSRIAPPAGYVRLAQLKQALGVRNDKLSEYARAGYIPTAFQARLYGQGPSSIQGTWWIAPDVARRLVRDRRAGRPMPWHGRPMADNLRKTWAHIATVRHPAACPTCRGIWGPAGRPRTFEDFAQRYPALARGAKRHLGNPFRPGLTLRDVAAQAGVSISTVATAIKLGVLATTGVGRGPRVTQTECTRWIARKCPTGQRQQSWLSPALACRLYGFTPRELQTAIAEHQLATTVVTDGPARGQTHVGRYALAQLRARIGYTQAEAAARLRVKPARLRALLRGLEWRPAPRITALVLKNCESRLRSEQGASIAGAAHTIGRPVSWVEAQIRAGHVRVSKTRWSARRYLTFPMFRRLCDLALERQATPTRRPSAEWLPLSRAAKLAGVSAAQLRIWARAGELRVSDRAGDTHAQVRGYHRRSVMTRARRYWKTCRMRRAVPPSWLRRERTAQAAD